MKSGIGLAISQISSRTTVEFRVTVPSTCLKHAKLCKSHSKFFSVVPYSLQIKCIYGWSSYSFLLAGLTAFDALRLGSSSSSSKLNGFEGNLQIHEIRQIVADWTDSQPL